MNVQHNKTLDWFKASDYQYWIFTRLLSALRHGDPAALVLPDQPLRKLMDGVGVGVSPLKTLDLVLGGS